MKLTDREIVERLTSKKDPDFEAFFFNRKCAPFLSKMRWYYFDNQLPLNELTNELIDQLKNDDWSKLKSFRFDTTLFGWLKTVARNHFFAFKKKMEDKAPPVDDEKKKLDLESQSPDDIKMLLEKVLIPKYRKILWMKYIEHKTDEEICDDLSVSEELYKKLTTKVENHLIRVIKNEGDIYEQMFLKPPEKKPVLPPTVYDPTEDIISKMDLEILINLIPNERNRSVLHSLMINDMEVEEVAKKHNISKGNVYVINSRWNKYLAQKVSKEKELWWK